MMKYLVERKGERIEGMIEGGLPKYGGWSQNSGDHEVTLPFLFWRVSLAALSSCDPGAAGVSRGGPVGGQLMLNGGWSSPATRRKNNAAALRLVFLYLLHMDNVPQR